LTETIRGRMRPATQDSVTPVSSEKPTSLFQVASQTMKTQTTPSIKPDQ